jgi:hypothetical protein
MVHRDDVREALYQHSDSRACRLVWEALDEDPSTAPDTVTYLEAARVTRGTVCLVASEDQADLYVRWASDVGRYVYVALWPPWGVVDAGAADRTTAADLLDARDDVGVVHFAETPFANDGPAADLSGRL